MSAMDTLNLHHWFTSFTCSLLLLVASVLGWNPPFPSVSSVLQSLFVTGLGLVRGTIWGLQNRGFHLIVEWRAPKVGVQGSYIILGAQKKNGDSTSLIQKLLRNTRRWWQQICQNQHGAPVNAASCSRGTGCMPMKPVLLGYHPVPRRSESSPRNARRSFQRHSLDYLQIPRGHSKSSH